MLWRGALIGGAAVLILLPGSIGGTPPVTTRSLDCRRVVLDPRPTWTISGEWVREGKELILPDVMAGRLLQYDGTGAHIGSAGHPGRGSSEFYRPAEIRKGTGELILVEGTERVLGLRGDLSPAWEVELRDVEFPSGDQVAFLGSFIVSGRALLGMVGIADERGGERWWGIGQLTLGDSPAVERLETLPSVRTPQGYLYYSHRGPYFAKVGTAIYALLYGDDPHIERLLPTRHRLRSFPEGYDSPVVPTSSGPASMPPSYRAWELSTAPVALFGRGELLYLLARKPHRKDGTLWMLYQIDPRQDDIVRSIVLPTRASHVVVVPGPADWAIVEKGPVTGKTAEQVVGPLVLIPSFRIENPKAPADLSACIPTGK